MENRGDSAPVRGQARLRRGLLWTAVGLLVVVVLAIGVALAMVDGGAVERRVQAKWLPALSERLGRDVTVAGVEVDLFPRPSAELRALRVEGEGNASMLEAKRVSARLSWWPLIRSLGQEVEISEVLLEEVDLRLMRRANGEWAIQEVIDRMADGSKSERDLIVERVSLKQGRVHVIDRAAKGGTGRLAATRIQLNATDVGVGEKLELSFRAAVGSEAHNVEGRLELGALPESFAGLAPADWPDVNARLELRAVPVERVEAWFPPGLAAVVSGGVLDLETHLTTKNDQWLLSGDSTGQWLLRGEPAQVSFSLQGHAPQGKPGQFVARMDPLKLQGPGVDASGHVAVDAAKRNVTFDLAGPLLDLDTLLGKQEEPPDGQPDEESPVLLSKSARRTLSSVQVAGKVRFDNLSAGRLAANDVKARAVLEEGVLRIEEAQGGLYGGSLDAAGSTIDLTQVVPQWHLTAKLDTVNLPKALTAADSSAGLKGMLDASVDLRGEGVSWAQLAPVLSGVAGVAVSNAALSGRDLSAQLLNGLTHQVDELGLSKLLGGRVTLPSVTGTELGDVATNVAVSDGWLTLRSPIAFQTPLGAMKLTGRMGLDRRLALTGTVLLKPEIVSSLTGGKVTPRAAIAVPFELGGLLESPRVTGLDTEAFVKAIARDQLVPDVRERIERGLGDDVIEKLPNLFGF